MRYELRSNSDGTKYYSFVHYDTKSKRQVRMTRAEIRQRFGKDILTKEDAESCLKLLEAKNQSEKTRILKRITWEQEFYSFKGLLEQYLEMQKKKAPNSWENNAFYLKHYVLFYFLQVSKLNNIDLWVDHFDDFRTWLEGAKKVRGNGTIAVSSMNHAIKSLNTFLDHLFSKKIITFTQKCPAFGEHLLNSRSIDDVVPPDHMEIIYKDLLDRGFTEEAVFYRYLYFSGMRWNEGKAVSVGCLFQGDLPEGFLKQKLKVYNIECFGYIVAEGQFKKRTDSGKVLLAPFKGQKIINEKNNRLVPIVDAELWNQLVDLAEKYHRKMSNHLTSKDVLLFPGLDDTTSSVRLRESYDRRNLGYKSWHCLRHSRATYLIGQTGDTLLAKYWLGHSSPRTLEKYNHIYQAIVREAKSKMLTGSEFKLKKV